MRKSIFFLHFGCLNKRQFLQAKKLISLTYFAKIIVFGYKIAMQHLIYFDFMVNYYTENNQIIRWVSLRLSAAKV